MAHPSLSRLLVRCSRQAQQLHRYSADTLRWASASTESLRALHESAADRRSAEQAQAGSAQDEAGHVRWVFLGPPGVGKGTYASRLGKHMDVPHISMGDLVREELRRATPLAQQMKEVTDKGLLLPDEVVLSLLDTRLRRGAEAGEQGFILDGFPRTHSQAAALEHVTPINLALNLSLREDVLLEKLLGRRMCAECGGNFNVANIRIPPTTRQPGILMPPLSPPVPCLDKMTIRSDDNEEVVKARLSIHFQESKPVEEFYRRRDLLLEFEILGGIPETWPRLLQALNIPEVEEEEMEDEDDVEAKQAF